MRRIASCLLLGMLVGSVRCVASDGFERVSVEIGPGRSDIQVREQLSAELARSATRLYRAGDFEAAYLAMRDALGARSPDSPAYRSLTDYSLIALRAGHLDESVASSREVILDAPDPALRAAAWFNAGLACEQMEQAGSPVTRYCSTGGVLQFLNAWGEAPTTEREHKIVQAMDRLPSACAVDVYFGRREEYHLVQTGEPATISESPQRIVVRHERGAPPPVEVVEFALDPGSAPRHPYGSREYELGRVSITVMQGLGEIRMPVRIRGQECRFD